MTEVASGFISTCAGVGGGWRQIANIGVSAGGDCPSRWCKATQLNVNFCRVVSDANNTYSSATNGTSYQKVCGRIRGYQKGRSGSFYLYHYSNQRTIDNRYVSGVSITYSSSHRHIWTYSGGLYDNNTAEQSNRPCAVGGGPAPPPFVGNHYYCGSGAADTVQRADYFFNDPLWDGSGCITSSCCEDSIQPWLYRDLNVSTTDDIEVRILKGSAFNMV